MAITVYFHSPCPDGEVAAGLAAQYYPKGAAFIGYNHDALPDYVLRATQVGGDFIFIDCAPELKNIGGLLQAANSVSVLDHHQCAARDFANFSHPKFSFKFNMEQSGAMMTWHEFNSGVPAPYYVRAVDAVDREQLHFPNFYEVAAFFDRVFRKSFATRMRPIPAIRASMELVLNLKPQEIVSIGARHLADEEAELVEMMQAAPSITARKHDGTALYTVPLIEGDIRHHGRIINFHLRSLAADERRSPDGFVAMCARDGEIIRLSLRSNEGVDVATIARNLVDEGRGLGGGGHPNAAACRFTPEQFKLVFAIDPPEPKNHRKLKTGQVAKQTAMERVA